MDWLSRIDSFHLYYISEWVIRLLMLAVIPRKREPSKALAWLLVIFLQPWAGLALFLLFGAQTVGRRRREALERTREALSRMSDEIRHHPALSPDGISDDHLRMTAFVERLGGLPVVGGNHVQVLPDATQFFDHLVADIDAAQHHVHMLFYIVNDDDVGRRVAGALGRAVARGVTCRVLADAMGSRPMFRTLGRKMSRAGVELRAALRMRGGLQWSRRVDNRNHRKIVVIDGKIGYTGSQNLTDPSYGHKDLIWRDLMARLTGPAVLELQAVFMSDWYSETLVMLDIAEHFPVPESIAASGSALQMLPSGPVYARENYQRVIISALHHAREHVTITTPYFVPDATFMQAIDTACLRHVRVDLIIPAKTDQWLPSVAARSYYEQLLDYGVHIHLHTDGLLHSKTMTVDDELSFFGSSNFDLRSFALNFEITMVAYGRADTEHIHHIQREYIEQSHLLTAEEWSRRHPIVRFFESFARLFSPML